MVYRIPIEGQFAEVSSNFDRRDIVDGASRFWANFCTVIATRRGRWRAVDVVMCLSFVGRHEIDND